jgi:pimeloyl-ACP methyl ester carboxylesterase
LIHVTTFVLVPGAGGAASYWSQVAPLLAARGHGAIAVDLPGDDESAGLPEYTDMVLSAISDHSDVVLVAASLAGFTAPLVCERVGVSGLVLVNAMIPVPGETPGQWWGDTGATEARDAAAAVGGYGPFDVTTYFLHDVAPEVLAQGAGGPRNEADAVFGSVCDFVAWPTVPIRVLAGADDRFFPVEFQRRIARDRLGIEADVRPGGHLIALSQPRAVADYLLG